MVKELQPAKAFSPIVVTESGMVIEVRAEQPKKAPSLISVREVGKCIVVKELQPAKAYSPIVVTESGMVIEVRTEQFTKK